MLQVCDYVIISMAILILSWLMIVACSVCPWWFALQAAMCVCVWKIIFKKYIYILPDLICCFINAAYICSS